MAKRKFAVRNLWEAKHCFDVSPTPTSKLQRLWWRLIRNQFHQFASFFRFDMFLMTLLILLFPPLMKQHSRLQLIFIISVWAQTNCRFCRDEWSASFPRIDRLFVAPGGWTNERNKEPYVWTLLYQDQANNCLLINATVNEWMNEWPRAQSLPPTHLIVFMHVDPFNPFRLSIEDEMFVVSPARRQIGSRAEKSLNPVTWHNHFRLENILDCLQLFTTFSCPGFRELSLPKLFNRKNFEPLKIFPR